MAQWIKLLLFMSTFCNGVCSSSAGHLSSDANSLVVHSGGSTSRLSAWTLVTDMRDSVGVPGA